MQLLFSHPQFQRDRYLHQTCNLSCYCDRLTPKATIAPPPNNFWSVFWAIAPYLPNGIKRTPATQQFLERALGDRPLRTKNNVCPKQLHQQQD